MGALTCASVAWLVLRRTARPSRRLAGRRRARRLRALLVAGDHRRRLHHQYRRGVPDPGPRAGGGGGAERAPVDRGGGGLRPRPRQSLPAADPGEPPVPRLCRGRGKGLRTPGRLPGRRRRARRGRPVRLDGVAFPPAGAGQLPGADRVLGRVPLLRRPQHLLPHRPEPQRRPRRQAVLRRTLRDAGAAAVRRRRHPRRAVGRGRVLPGRLASRALVRGAGVRGQQLPPRRRARLQLRTPPDLHLPPLSAGRLLHPRAMAGARRARTVPMGAHALFRWARTSHAAASRLPRCGARSSWRASAPGTPGSTTGPTTASPRNRRGRCSKSPRRTASSSSMRTRSSARCPIFTG